MRISKKVRVAGGVLAGSLLLVGVAGQVSARVIGGGAAGGAIGGGGGGGGGDTGTSDPCGSAIYSYDGYSCGTTSPDPKAVLVHVKLRGHLHELDFQFNGGGELDLQRKNSETVWFNPDQHSGGSVTLAGNSTVSFSANQNTCFFEDKHGNLAWASSGGDCTPY